MKTSPRIALGLAAIAAAGAGGFLAYRLAGDRPPEAEMASSASPTQNAPDPSPGNAQRAIPERLPDFRLEDREGVERSLSEWSGRPLLVNFWATWCAPCRREIPLLQKLRQERSEQNVEVIGIAVDLRDAVLKYASEIGLEYPLLIGEEDGLKAIDALGMDMLFPFTVFSDRQDRIVTVKVGELHENEANFILDRIADIDSGRLELQEAREQIAAQLREFATARANQEPAAAPPTAIDLDDHEH